MNIRLLFPFDALIKFILFVFNIMKINKVLLNIFLLIVDIML